MNARALSFLALFAFHFDVDDLVPFVDDDDDAVVCKAEPKSDGQASGVIVMTVPEEDRLAALDAGYPAFAPSDVSLTELTMRDGQVYVHSDTSWMRFDEPRAPGRYRLADLRGQSWSWYAPSAGHTVPGGDVEVVSVGDTLEMIVTIDPDAPGSRPLVLRGSVHLVWRRWTEESCVRVPEAGHGCGCSGCSPWGNVGSA